MFPFCLRFRLCSLHAFSTSRIPASLGRQHYLALLTSSPCHAPEAILAGVPMCHGTGHILFSYQPAFLPGYTTIYPISRESSCVANLLAHGCIRVWIVID